MKFLKQTLQDGERPVCRSRLHGIYLVAGFLWFAGLAAVGWFADYQLWVNFGAYIPPYEISNTYFQIAFAPGQIGWAFTAGGAFILLAELVKFFSTHLVITTKRLIYKSGFIRVKVDSTEIGDILGAHVDQGWFGQFLGYGKLHLDCRFIEDVYIPYIKNPYGVVKGLQKVRQGLTAEPPMDKKSSHTEQMQPVSQTLIQITGNNPVYIVDKVPADDKAPLRQLPKSLGDNMMNAFKKKA